MSSITGVVCSIHGDQAPLNYCPKCDSRPIERDELLRVATQLAAGSLNENTAYHVGGEVVISNAIVYAKTLIEKVNQEFSE